MNQKHASDRSSPYKKRRVKCEIKPENIRELKKQT
jgi:hypothetical protein